MKIYEMKEYVQGLNLMASIDAEIKLYKYDGIPVVRVSFSHGDKKYGHEIPIDNFEKAGSCIETCLKMCLEEYEKLTKSVAMTPKLHRTLWGVIPGGYWIAWDHGDDLYWYSEKPTKGELGWKARLIGHLPDLIEKPEGIPWNESAMEMPMGAPPLHAIDITKGLLPKLGREWWIAERMNINYAFSSLEDAKRGINDGKPVKVREVLQ